MSHQSAVTVVSTAGHSSVSARLELFDHPAYRNACPWAQSKPPTVVRGRCCLLMQRGCVPCGFAKTKPGTPRTPPEAHLGRGPLTTATKPRLGVQFTQTRAADGFHQTQTKPTPAPLAMRAVTTGDTRGLGVARPSGTSRRRTHNPSPLPNPIARRASPPPGFDPTVDRAAATTPWSPSPCPSRIWAGRRQRHRCERGAADEWLRGRAAQQSCGLSIPHPRRAVQGHCRLGLAERQPSVWQLRPSNPWTPFGDVQACAEG